MTQFNNRLDKIFDVTPTEIVTSYNDDGIIPEYLPKVQDNKELTALLSHDLKNDYETVRESINNLISLGTEAVTDMLAIARESERGRDYEITSNMIKQMVENSKDLLDIQKQMKSIHVTRDSSGTTNIKNAVFVGSTTELLKAMKELKLNE